jgi:DNA-binding CsgD family transcriptional regulator
MELSPTEARLKSIGNIDLFKTDQKYDFKLTDILRKRQRPLLLLIDRNGELLFTSLPPPSSANSPTPEERNSRLLIDEALLETQRLFKQQHQPVAASVVEQLTINKPGERCALVILGNEFYCLRLFSLQNGIGERGEVYAALVEPISKPQKSKMDAAKLRGLSRLSKRELDVLNALMSGDTDKEIALKLTVSVETVRAYLKSIRAKLGAKTRTAIHHHHARHREQREHGEPHEALQRLDQQVHFPAVRLQHRG